MGQYGWKENASGWLRGGTASASNLAGMRTRLLLTGKGLLLAVSLIAGAESEKEVFRKDVFVRKVYRTI